MLRETGVALAVALGIGVAALAVAWPLCRSRDRAVCLACGLVGWCIWYAGFAYWLATALGIGPMAGGSTHIGIALWTLGWLVYAVAIVRGFATRVLAPAWLVVSIALVAMPAITLVTFPFRAAPPTAPLPTIPLRAEAAPPDIYYLVFDRYGSPETIRERYGFDTAPFLAELRRRGFHVAERSNANYFKTALSLASSLNLTYVNEIYAGLRESRDLRPMYTLVEEHRVGRSLRAVGYDYLHLGAWWEPTRENRHATENLSFTPVSLFLHSAYVHTPLVEA
ncbi:MAG TPA: hypothetical protein VNN07_19170, partial [Candidatus Tectomicrobia bacterium]|nr:hypothetical protein [Candidatus Tectomicrobia bacterium]